MAPVWMGLDVAKDSVVMAVDGVAATKTFLLAGDGVAALIAALRRAQPTLIVLEATGGYEQPWVTACVRAQLPVVVVNPRQVRAFAKAIGRTAKTDAIDALVLAAFAARVQPPVRTLPDAARQELDALVARRQQLVTMCTAEQQRLGQARARKVRQSLRRTSPGSSSKSMTPIAPSTTSSTTRRSGGSRTTCCKACPALGPSPRGPSSRGCLSSGTARTARWRP